MKINLFFQNAVGLFDSLVDEEDFPRNDIDVYQVRNARHQIICKIYKFTLSI